MPATKLDGPFKGFMARKITMPKYQPPDTTKPEKEDSMYSVQWPSYSNNDVQKRIDNVLGPLSLFAPFPHEDEPEYEEIELERPITPINEEIKIQPPSLDKLQKFIQRRIATKPDVPFLSMADQQNLAGIIMAEVSNIWPDIRRQIDDPFLTPEENKELNRRIAVHIVTVSEKLFHHYLEKAKVLNSRGIFSGPANMSRLKAQLALDSNKFFNILMVRRYIVSDMRGSTRDGETTRTDEVEFMTTRSRSSHLPTTVQPTFDLITYQGMIQTSRPKSKLKKKKLRTVDEEVKEMSSCMPSLDTRKLLDLVADLPERDLRTPSEDLNGTSTGTPEQDSRLSHLSSEEISRKRVLLKRSNSVSGLQAGETILEELGADIQKIHDDKLLNSEMEILYRERQIIEKKKLDKGKKSVIKPGTKEYLANDLKQLMSQREEKEEMIADEDLPPLLQAITRNARHDDLKVRMERKMKELEEQERKRKDEESIVIREPTKPQPATVSSKVSDKLVVRTSDVRVSERVCMSSLTLDKYSTVYNDLLGEIDPATIKTLDKNLFLSEEIREVYKEIMKTIPTQHLKIDDDAMFMPGAENINFSGLTASASLQKKPHERVINPNITKGDKSPWGDVDPKNWANMPDGFGQLKKSLDESDVKSTKNSNLTSTNTQPNPDHQMGTNQKISSWLTWWRNTVTSDDYMKYLSTQETDYLGAVYHFYDSEDEDDYDAGGGGAGPSYRGGIYSRGSHHSKINITESKEKREKREELLKQKEEYLPGMWNVNTILLGGLGKDPTLEDETDRKPVVKEKSHSAKTLTEKAAIAREAKASLGHSRGPSCLSKSTVTPVEADKTPQPPKVTPQDRLEKVWTALHMPDGLKLDMAIKYSCNEFFLQLPEAIYHWEKVTAQILKRENLLEKLEKFERKASDPNRFFEKGHRGSSVNRLEEAKQRSAFYKRIDLLEEELTKELEYIKQTFQDIITYRGRPYVDKMKWDRIEMLYWLQEERKEHGMKYEAAIRQLPLKQALLEPIQHQHS